VFNFQRKLLIHRVIKCPTWSLQERHRYGVYKKDIGIKTKPTLKRIKDGKKIAMKKKINIGCPISNQIYVFYLKRK
jgi:hypothetical protein